MRMSGLPAGAVILLLAARVAAIEPAVSPDGTSQIIPLNGATQNVSVLPPISSPAACAPLADANRDYLPGIAWLDLAANDGCPISDDPYTAALEDPEVAPAWYQSRLSIPGQQRTEQRPAGTGLFSNSTGFGGTGLNRFRMNRSGVFGNSFRGSSSITGIGPGFRIRPGPGDVANHNRASDLFRIVTAPPAATQNRNPIYSDVRPRGQTVGQSESGSSWWVPARADLDTVISKIDSRLVDEIHVVPGPYSTWNGPAFSHTKVELLHSPRFDTFESHGASGFDFQSNGTQRSARQDVHGGGPNYGFRAGIGHQVGSNYRAGNGVEIPAGYESLDANLTLGFDLNESSSLEFTFLHVDQSDVEMPGQAFDINSLVSNAFDVEYVVESHGLLDELAVELWTNATRLTGDTQDPEKLRQFPLYETIGFTAVTDATVRSTGFRIEGRRGDEDFDHLNAGVDFRHVRQQLDEISSVTNPVDGFSITMDENSPIPDSRSVNPGLFAEFTHPTTDGRLKVGGRLDIQSSDLLADPNDPTVLNREFSQFTLAEIFRSDQVHRDYIMGSGWVIAEHDVTDEFTLSASAGVAQRPPTLTELYAVETFMFVLQNGLNTVTGNPRLNAPTMWQTDLGMKYQGSRWNAELRGFHSWIHDHVTYENVSLIQDIDNPELAPPQINLQYVNTELATITGAEFNTAALLTGHVSLFGAASAQDGRDRTRNGNGATIPARDRTAAPAEFDPDDNRGSFSGVKGSAAEPLPGMPPFQSRLGFRIHDYDDDIENDGDGDDDDRNWQVEVSARIVGHQDRVATSLFENTTAGFTVYDLRVFRRFGDNLLVTAGIDNITNKSYREFLDFRSQNGLSLLRPGISSSLAVQLTY